MRLSRVNVKIENRILLGSNHKKCVPLTDQNENESHQLFTNKREPNNMKKDRKVTCFKIAQNSIYFFALFILVLILLFQVSNSTGYSWNVPRSHWGPWLFWSPRNLVLEKNGPQKIWSPINLVPTRKFLLMAIHAETKFCGDLISCRENHSGTLSELEPVCCKTQQKKVPDQLLVCGISEDSKQYKIAPGWSRESLGRIYNQFGIIQVLQRYPFWHTSNWSGTFFCYFLRQTGPMYSSKFLTWTV